MAKRQEYMTTLATEEFGVDSDEGKVVCRFLYTS